MRTTIVSYTLAVFLLGCATKSVTSPVRERMLMCGGGGEVTIFAAELEAKIAEDLRDDNKISASVKDGILLAFTEANVSERNAVSMQENYLACLERPLPSQ